MDRPLDDIDGCRIAHQRLGSSIGDIDDNTILSPSLLPGWSVGHVLTHLARNADAMSRRIQGAVISEIVEQYDGGPLGRSAEIELGARRTAVDIRDDVIRASFRLDQLFESIDDDVWGRPVRTIAGTEHPLARLPFQRWFEVEVHLVDLGLGFSSHDWSRGLVDRTLPRLIAGLSQRSDERALMSWLLGRGQAPDLKPWR